MFYYDTWSSAFFLRKLAESINVLVFPNNLYQSSDQLSILIKYFTALVSHNSVKTASTLFQTLMGTPRVENLNIILRILDNADLRCKTEFGTTFLHESVKHNLPAQFVSRLLQLGVSLEERELHGFTARELAEQKGYTHLMMVHDTRNKMTVNYQ